MKRPGYLREFLEFWTPREEIRKIWFSMFTPQIGDQLPEMLQPAERAQAIEDMLALRKTFPKLDMPEGLIRQFASPPHSPAECVFALTTQTVSADLKTRIVPCQFGGNPAPTGPAGDPAQHVAVAETDVQQAQRLSLAHGAGEEVKRRAIGQGRPVDLGEVVQHRAIGPGIERRVVHQLVGFQSLSEHRLRSSRTGSLPSPGPGRTPARRRFPAAAP